MFARLKVKFLKWRLRRAEKLREALRGETELRLAFGDADAYGGLKGKTVAQLQKLFKRYSREAVNRKYSEDRAAAWHGCANRVREELERRAARGVLQKRRDLKAA